MSSHSSSLRALQQWCTRQCASYPGINIRDMTNSFRNGLAFCAIIHRYHPELIDFYTLDQDDVLENNRLAFSVAETSLGIPALLDAEDMVEMDTPDRLSVITYLSQYYHHFKDKIPYEERNNGSSEDMLHFRGGSPPRYRLNDPNRYAMFKPSPPPRPLAAKKNNWSSSSLSEQSSERVTTTSNTPQSSSPALTPTTSCCTPSQDQDRSSTQDCTTKDVFAEREHKQSGTSTASKYQTPPNSPPRERPMNPPPRRRQKRESWNALMSSGESGLDKCPGSSNNVGPKTSLTMIAGQEGQEPPSWDSSKSSPESVQKTSLSTLDKSHNSNGFAVPNRIDEKKTIQELEDIINSIHEPSITLQSEDFKLDSPTTSAPPRSRAKCSSYYNPIAQKSGAVRRHEEEQRRKPPNNQIMSEQDVGKIMTRAYDPDGGSSRGNLCFICGSHVYLLERTVARQRLFHRQCFVCNGCGTKLLLGMYEVYDGDSMFYCKSCFKKIKLREGCRSDEYREALGCPVTDPEELWSLPPHVPELEEEQEDRSLSPLEEEEDAHHVRFNVDEYSEGEENVRRSSEGKRPPRGSASESDDDLRPRSLSCGASDPNYATLELDNSQRKRRSLISMKDIPHINKFFSPILKRSKRNVFDYSSLQDIDKALKEEEEVLIEKKRIYNDELNENEHQQKQMELCGQGLEMKLRDQETNVGFDDDALFDWFELVNRKNRLSHLESVLVISIKEIEINLQQKALERQLRDLHNVRKKYKERYIKSKEQELIRKLVELVEERDHLVNMEETQRLSAIEMDKQFREVMSATAGITV